MLADPHTREADQGKIQWKETSIDRKDDQEATLLSCVARKTIAATQLLDKFNGLKFEAAQGVLLLVP